VYVPALNLYFHTAPLQTSDWVLPLATGAICLSIYELKKKISNYIKQKRKVLVS